jgi:hypothetical protein
VATRSREAEELQLAVESLRSRRPARAGQLHGLGGCELSKRSWDAGAGRGGGARRGREIR